MNTRINRRDFLKLAAMLPLANLKLPSYSPGSPDQPNILIIVLDALSARHMSLYGYPRVTTPYIENFAERATVFHNHYAGGNFTTPGTASLLTGTLPWTHHAFHIHGMVNDLSIPHNLFNQVPPGTYTTSYTHNLFALTLLYQFRDSLAELVMPRKLALKDFEFSDQLFKNDYNIAYIGENISLNTNNKAASSLFLSLFDRLFKQNQERQINKKYDNLFPVRVPEENGVIFILEDSINWAIEQVKSLPQPYLAYFHFLPPHDPYLPTRDFIGKFRGDGYFPVEKPKSFASLGLEQKALNNNCLLYDEYLAYADFEFGRLVSEMQKNGLLDTTYLILTSDHGELFERGISGHVTPVLYESIVHIPLIISRPGIDTRMDIYDQTSCIDVLPTILNIYGQPIPQWCEGRILPSFASQDSSIERAIFAMDNKSNPKYGPITSGTLMAIQGNYKLINNMNNGGPVEGELYNLKNDPEELENLVNSQRSITESLRKALSEKFNSK
jgi:arylsulfatase A-like enzyme